MQDVFSMVQAISPDLNRSLRTRIDVLQALQSAQGPLGRKLLAQRVVLSERSLRTIIDLMKEQGLVTVSKAGIQLTEHGQITAQIALSSRNVPSRRPQLEARLKEALHLEECWVVPGNLDRNQSVYQLLSQAVEQILQMFLKFGHTTIAVTGGETLAHVGEGFTPNLSQNRDLVFVPARGGVGGDFSIQSNMVGGLMAQRTQAKYVPLFIPDTVKEDASRILMQDPSINQALLLSKEADALLVSVGSASTMAQRRELTTNQQALLQEKNAIGEVFGLFFDQDGQEVLRLPRMGIQFEDVEQIPLVLTIVAGASKAAAVKGYSQLVQGRGWLVCDEGLATMILNGETH